MNLTTILAALGAVVQNIDAFRALGADIADMFEKGQALVSSDTASTPEQRAEAEGVIADLRNQMAERLEELRQIEQG